MNILNQDTQNLIYSLIPGFITYYIFAAKTFKGSMSNDVYLYFIFTFIDKLISKTVIYFISIFHFFSNNHILNLEIIINLFITPIVVGTLIVYFFNKVFPMNDFNESYNLNKFMLFTAKIFTSLGISRDHLTDSTWVKNAMRATSNSWNITVYLNDGEIIYGRLGNNSELSPDSKDVDLYLEPIYQDKLFSQPLNKSVYIKGNQIKKIEFSPKIKNRENNRRKEQDTMMNYNENKETSYETREDSNYNENQETSYETPEDSNYNENQETRSISSNNTPKPQKQTNVKTGSKKRTK